MFNQTTRRWHAAPEEILNLSDMLRFLAELTGFR